MAFDPGNSKEYFHRIQMGRWNISLIIDVS
jgi:hypothetical protein